MRRTWIGFSALGVAAVLVFVGARVLRHTSHPAASTGSGTAVAAPPAGTTVDIRVLPASPVDALPFVGAEGDAEDGWPRRSVDRAALVGMLHAGRYHTLTEWAEQLQAAFEADPTRERWINEVMLAFRQGDLALDAPLDAWVAAEPSSFAPYLARCAHRDAVGWDRRGTGVASATSAAAMSGMREIHAQARVDCERAIALRPGLVVARQRILSLARTSSDDATADRALAEALAACPTCYRIRYVDLGFRAPRWGGSLEQMRAVADAAIRAHPEAPHLRALAGRAAQDECDRERDPRRALAACDAAARSGEESEYFVDRARARAAMQDEAGALADLEHALEIDPQEVEALVLHASRIAVSRPEQAMDEILTAARVDPSEQGVSDEVTWARERARLLALEAVGRRDAAGIDAALERARQLGVSESERAAWRAEIDELAPLTAAMAASPDDVDVYRAMDAALLQLGASTAVLAMWDEYLTRHPDAGAAYFERSGTHALRRERELAAQDARRACDLGVAEACAYAGPRATP